MSCDSKINTLCGKVCWLLKQVVNCRVTALTEWANRERECNLINNYSFYFGHPVVQMLFIILTCLYDISDEEEEEDVGSYWMTLKKGEDTLI